MTHEVVNGSFKSEPTDRDRSVVADNCVLTVKPDGKTACFVRNGIKWPGGRKVIMYVGELDGVRCYVHESNGKTHIFLTKQNIEP